MIPLAAAADWKHLGLLRIRSHQILFWLGCRRNVSSVCWTWLSAKDSALCSIALAESGKQETSTSVWNTWTSFVGLMHSLVCFHTIQNDCALVWPGRLILLLCLNFSFSSVDFTLFSLFLISVLQVMGSLPQWAKGFRTLSPSHNTKKEFEIEEEKVFTLKLGSQNYRNFEHCCFIGSCLSIVFSFPSISYRKRTKDY